MIENLILAHLVKDEEYSRKVIPFLKEEYFGSEVHKLLFKQIEEFVHTYKATPTFDALKLSIEQASIAEGLFKESNAVIEELIETDRTDASRKAWLINETEKFCQSKALYNAISTSIGLLDKDIKSASGVPDIIKEALAISFDNHIGHDYFEDIAARFDLIHEQQTRIPFDIDLLNTITKGGLLPKTLNVIVAGTAVGKSLMLCHVASAAISQGKNVLYVTLEMAEERIAHRIDANLLDVSMEAIDMMPRKVYENAFAQLRKRHAFGKLIIKEYPTSGAHVGHFKSLLDDLALKRQFTPDLIIIDYINICSSTRYKNNGQVNSYNYVKAIAEELRGLSVEYGAPILSATQFNREGFDSTDPGLTNTSESFGLPQTADLQIALVTSDELERDGLLMVKQLKNRYSDSALHRRFTVKVDRSKMRISNDPLQTFLGSQQAQAPQSQTKSYSPSPKIKSNKAMASQDSSSNGTDIIF